jgi:hypothetical protein
LPGLQQRSNLRDDLVRLAIACLKIFVTLGIKIRESLGGASQDFDSGMAGTHRVDVREMEHPRISTGVHGLRQDQATEFAVVGGSPDDDSRFVRLAIRRA